MKKRSLFFTLTPLVFMVLGAAVLMLGDRHFHQRLKQETQFAFDSLMQSGVNRTQSLVIAESLQSSTWQAEMYAQEVGFIAVFIWPSLLIPMASRIASLEERLQQVQPGGKPQN